MDEPANEQAKLDLFIELHAAGQTAAGSGRRRVRGERRGCAL